MKKIGMLFGTVMVLLFLLMGCGKDETPEEGQIVKVYYINKEETKIDSEPRVMLENLIDKQINEMLGFMQSPPENTEYKAVLDGRFSILGTKLDDRQLVVAVDEHYKELDTATEVLVRAAIVRNLTQISGIDYVSMKVRNDALTDAAGNPVGIMEASTFIDNAGDEINAYERVKLKLYFADESGTGLIETNRTVVYNTNISLEKLVMEQLIKGPEINGVYPTINPETILKSVTVKDGICYVNLSEKFQEPTTSVTSEVTIYSITNSLVELPNINKVQFSIDGNTDVVYRETYPLSTIFERNLELMKN